ncbi:hypothetical protein LCGC14_2226690 [marine sediment metagenome]|uniref:Uncharacterized protein n=1 Tax=marine sediment metagenome TaxID=412755 RepID=A0A0F9G4W3_9ZZZZ
MADSRTTSLTRDEINVAVQEFLMSRRGLDVNIYDVYEGADDEFDVVFYCRNEENAK